MLTPPIDLDPTADVSILSQIRSKDLLMYLLAVKSFARQVSLRAVHVLDDGTLTNADLATLEAHIPGHALHQISDFRSDRCPDGGTWERLLAISSLVRDSYVVQLDADTLTVGPMDEVNACAGQGRAFTIGTWDNQSVESMKERRDVALKYLKYPNAHIQIVAEANLDKLVDFESRRYIRGCSGFAGFPKNSFTRGNVERISEQMYGAIGERWHQWGTEQFTSNVLVANMVNPLVLPHPKYCDCTQPQISAAVFVHFIGTCRFKDGVYARFGQNVIASWQGVSR